MKTSDQTDKLWPAVVKARQAMKNPTKDSTNPHFRSKYADLAAVLDVVDEACTQAGLVTLQELTGDAAGVSVSTIILHNSGQWVQFDPLFVPASKLDPQGFGSAATYTRRYAMKAAWNLADEDDDGNAASQKSEKPVEKTPEKPAVNHALGAPATKGYFFVTDYKKDGHFHTAQVLGADGQGGAVRVKTKLAAVGKELAICADGRTECAVDLTMAGRGEAWLNSIKSRVMHEAAEMVAPIPLERAEVVSVHADEIPF